LGGFTVAIALFKDDTYICVSDKKEEPLANALVTDVSDDRISRKGDSISFTIDKKHMDLLDYLTRDMSGLPLLMGKYVSKKMDIINFALNNYAYKADDTLEINKSLTGIHPYYKLEGRKTIIDAIGNYFNALLINAQRNGTVSIPANDEEWYTTRFEAICIPYLKIGDKFAQESYLAYRKIIGDKGGHKIEVALNSKLSETGFIYEIGIQRIIRQMLLWIWDSPFPVLEELTIPQRLWLYAKVFKKTWNGYQASVTRPLFINDYPCMEIKNGGKSMAENENPENQLFSPLYTALIDFPDYQNDRLSDTTNLLVKAVEYIKSHPMNANYEQYEITSLHHLLLLEITKMVEANITVRKCRNCGRYFVATNLNMAYCSRIADGETKPCNVIGSTNAYTKKVDGNKVLELYNRAYRTRHARRSKGTMTDNEFNMWCEEAKKKREQVIENKLTLSEFEQWLSQDARRRRRS
jgi:hypothetical protein